MGIPVCLNELTGILAGQPAWPETMHWAHYQSGKARIGRDHQKADMDSSGGDPRYRWLILALSALTFTFVVAMPTMCMPVLFEEIGRDLNLSLVQIGAVWGMAPLAGVFVVLAGGMLGDRFGAKRVLAVSCVLAGTAGAVRGFSDSFGALAATLFLFGLLTAAIPPVVHKTCGVWFSGRYLALANAVVSMGMAVGFTLGAMVSATILSPALGGWRNVLFLYGGMSVLIGILWLFTHGRPDGVETSGDSTGGTPFRQALSSVARNRRVWLLAFILVGQSGCVQGMFGYLPLYLRDAGWDPAGADGTLAAFHAISIVGTIPLALLSNRLGSRRTVLFGAALMTALGVGLLSVVDGTMVWVAVVVAGVVRDGFMAVLMTTIIETEGVGATYAGTASGLILTLSRPMGFASPPVGNSLAGVNPGLPFIFWAALAAVVLPGFCFLREKRQGPVMPH